MAVRLQIKNGSTSIQWSSDLESIVIGREQSCDLVIGGENSEGVSWRHCQLEVRPSGLFIFDARSTNGTFVNGKRIETRKQVYEGDNIRLGAGPVAIEITRISPPSGSLLSTCEKPLVESVPNSRSMVQVAKPELIFEPSPAFSAHGYVSATRQLLIGLHQGSRRQFWQLIVLVGTLSVVFISVVISIWWSYLCGLDETNASLRNISDDLEGTKSSLSGVNSRLDQLSSQDLDQIYDRYSDAVYLVGCVGPNGRVVHIGTAFAIDANGKFITNAHVAVTIDHLLKSERTVSLISPGGNHVFDIKATSIHPRYIHSDEGATRTPDIAIITASLGRISRLPIVLPLASFDELRNLRPGIAICYIGYPGNQDNDYETVSAVVPRTYSGTINRILTFDGRKGDFEAQCLIEHDTQGSPGRSGSPLINAQGKVVGVHFAGYGLGHGGADSSAIRIDLVHDISPK